MKTHYNILLLYLVFSALDAFAVRSLPAGWSSTASTWIPVPDLRTGYSYSTADTVYYKTPSMLFRKIDETRWEIVESPDVNDEDPGRTRAFRIIDFTTVDERGLLDPTLPEINGVHHRDGYQRAVFFQDHWWTAHLKSSDGEHWEISEFGNFLKNQGTAEEWPDEDPTRSIESATPYTDGVSLALYITGTTRPGGFILYHYFYRELVGSQIEGNSSWSFMPGNHIGMFHKGEVIPFQPSQILSFYPTEIFTKINEHQILISDGTASVAVRDPSLPNAFMANPIPLDQLSDVRWLEAIQGIVVAVDSKGQVAYSGDGFSWTPGAKLPPNGHLGVVSNEFYYSLPTRLYCSINGEHWNELSVQPPTQTAMMEPRLNGNLAYEDTDGNQLPDRVWRRLGEDDWQLISEGVDFKMLNYFPELQIAFMRPYSTPAHTFDSNSFGEIVWSGGRTMILSKLEYFPGALYNLPTEAVLRPDYDASDMIWEEGFFFTDNGSVYDASLGKVEKVRTGYGRSHLSLGNRLLAIDRTHIYLSDPLPPYPFQNGLIRPWGWRGSDWFGWVHTTHYPWVYQYPAGWIYVLGPDETDCWMWDTTEGWFWSNRDHWPEIWDKEEGWRQHANIPEWVW